MVSAVNAGPAQFGGTGPSQSLHLDPLVLEILLGRTVEFFIALHVYFRHPMVRVRKS